MADRTGIEWTHHTFNTWEGCSQVSPACRFCYARRDSKRWNPVDLWRRKGPRKFRSDDYWRKPLRWNRAARRAGQRARVFCASMADLFEEHPVADINAQMDAARARLWDMIAETPALDWQLLTKRPENVAGMVPWGSTWPANVWLGTSVENQRYADERIPILMGIPARVRFLSCEPLLGPVDLSRWLGLEFYDSFGWGDEMFAALNGQIGLWRGGLHWVITGGESGPRARPTHPDWTRQLRDQCAAAGIPFLYKQHGEWLPVGPLYGDGWDEEEADQARHEAVAIEVHEGKRVIELERSGYIVEGHQPGDDRTWLMAKVGKKAAGRELDGRTWDEFPEVARG